MIDWIVNVHPYLASFIFLVLWCSLGYVESRLISPGFACVTWFVALIAVTLALLRITELGLLRWFLAVLVLSVGTTWIFRFYRAHKQNYVASRP